MLYSIRCRECGVHAVNKILPRAIFSIVLFSMKGDARCRVGRANPSSILKVCGRSDSTKGGELRAQHVFRRRSASLLLVVGMLSFSETSRVEQALNRVHRKESRVPARLLVSVDGRLTARTSVCTVCKCR